MTTSLDLDARAANWLAELDPALAQLAHALPPVSAGGQWLLHDARWTPGQGCRLAYRSPASAPAPVFLDVNVTPSGWAHRDYRDDDMLPGLASAADPAAVAALLGTLDGEAVEQCWVEPVRYRPASRCVLRYRVRTASRETALFAKVFQAGEFAALSPVLTSLADRAGAPELVPEVVALWPQLQAVLVRAVPGRSASSVLSDPRVPAAERLALARRVGRLLAEFHQQSGIEAPSWSAADQLAGLADSMAAADCADRRLAAHYRSVLELLAVAPPAETHPVLAHGAFRAGQVVLGDDGHLTALDLDGICHSDRGRDLGNVLAYLMWQGVRQPQQRHAMDEAGRAILSAYEEVAGPLDEPSLDWWRAAGLLQVAARRFRRLETRDWTLTPILVERAAELLRPPRTRQAPHAAADLLDPRWMSGVLRVALAPAQRSAAPLQVESAEQLSPSSGRRAVIRYRVRGLDGPDPAAVVGKVFAEPQRAQLVYEHLRVLSEALPATQELGVPEPLALLPERGLVVYRHGEGTPLSGIHDPAEALRGVQAAARWLAQLHSSQVALPRRVDLAQEVKTTREWAELISGIYPWAAAQARWVADHWAAQATAPRTGRAVPLHRDFHPGHVLVGDRICVIDLDEARQGDAAFDIAHFCAYVELLMRVPADDGSEGTLSAASLVSAFVEEYAAATGWADGGSVAGFTAYTWLKIAKQWATAAGPCRGASAEQRLDGVADALGRGQSCLNG